MAGSRALKLECLLSGFRADACGEAAGYRLGGEG